MCSLRIISFQRKTENDKEARRLVWWRRWENVKLEKVKEEVKEKVKEEVGEGEVGRKNTFLQNAELQGCQRVAVSPHPCLPLMNQN